VVWWCDDGGDSDGDGDGVGVVTVVWWCEVWCRGVWWCVGSTLWCRVDEGDGV
jgi:hypothetical protein